MAYRDSITARRRILLGILIGVMLLGLCASGVVVAAPSVTVTISLTTTPQPPTDFEITQTGISTINITWAKGLGANITIARVSTSGYPFSVFDGDAVYSGNGTSVEVGSLDLTNNTYYFRAWSQNEYATSIGYAQDSIGHGAEDEGSLDLSALIDWLNTFIGGPMGINSIIFILGLMGFAFWKKGWIRVVLSLGIITWGAFAVNYDIKVAAPLLGIGTVLFITGILNVIAQHRESQTETQEVHYDN